MRRITERRQATLAHLAYYDTLTGLPNRQLFLDRLWSGDCQRGAQSPAALIFYIDLDRFKVVNDGLDTRLATCCCSRSRTFPIGHPPAGHRRAPER